MYCWVHQCEMLFWRPCVTRKLSHSSVRRTISLRTPSKSQAQSPTFSLILFSSFSSSTNHNQARCHAKFITALSFSLSLFPSAVIQQTPHHRDPPSTPAPTPRMPPVNTPITSRWSCPTSSPIPFQYVGLLFTSYPLTRLSLLQSL